MAHKKGVGSSKNGRDTAGKRLGCKLFDGQAARGGNIIVRQRGNKFWAGANVGTGRDFTLFAKVDGQLKFYRARGRKYIAVVPQEQAETSEVAAD